MHLFKSLVVLLLFATLGLQAQEGFYYQAVIKNTDGSPLQETSVRIRIRIIEGETDLQHEEVRTLTTSREGFVSFIIGEGASAADFAAINWQGELYLEDEIDTTGEGYGPPTRMPLLKNPRSYIADRAISVLDNSITSASILDGSITSDDLADDSITTTKLINGVVTAQKLATAAVTENTLAEASVSSAAVIDSTLTNADISPDAAIAFSKVDIPNGSITLDKINLTEGSIDYSNVNVSDGAIDFSKLTIPNGSITYAQLSIGDTLIPYGKIKVDDSEIPFEKLAITQANINSLGIVSNYTAGTNISISEEASIALSDEISLSSVTADLTGDLFNTSGTRVLDSGNETTAASFTGNVVGNLNGSLLNAQNQTILTNGTSSVPAKYFGDTYFGETLVVDASEQKFYGTLVGSWSGNLIGANNDIILDPDDNGVAVFTGNVLGNLTGNVTGNVSGNLTGDVEGDVEGNVTGDLTGDVLADDGTTVLDNGATSTAATFSGNAATATTLSETLSIEKGGTGATTAADARTNLELGTASITDATAYATADQGALADTAQQVLTEGAFVDGDKTKLDGIEVGADVTDATNVEAAGALMDSEVTNLAQIKTFDAANYATADQGALADTALQPANDLSDLNNATTARTNLGLFTGTGSIAVGENKVTLTPSSYAFISGLSDTDVVIVTATSITTTTPGATSLYAKCNTNSIEVFTANGSDVTSSAASFNFILIK